MGAIKLTAGALDSRNGALAGGRASGPPQAPMHGKHGDSGFEAFRRERQRLRAKVGNVTSGNFSSDALRELEAVEAREERDQQLTREVHDFFAAATRQAAGIVERVSREAEAEVGQRLEREVESFLIDALARMNGFVLGVLQQRRGTVAEQRLEPSVQNLVGQPLDEFRWAGTAELPDRHIGQDPFATAVSAVRGELRGAEAAAAHSGAGPAAGSPVAAPDAEAAAVADPTGSAQVEAPAVERPGAASETPIPAGDGKTGLAAFQEALRGLVRSGTMTQEEARAAWQTRLRAMGAVAAPTA